MGRDNRAEVTHRHTTSDIRGGRFPEGMLPSAIIPSIEAAQATATSKSKVVFSANVASGTNFSEGDTWYQRASGIIIAQWEFTSGAWHARTLDSAVIANLDASKITTGTLAAGQKITAGDPVGSRVELDSAGLRKYATDGTTVQVDLTGTTAAFSGLITGSEIIGGVLKTASTGARVEIAPVASPPGGVVRFHSGSVNETYPAEVWAGSYGAGGAYGYVEIISPSVAGSSQAELILTTGPTQADIGLYTDKVYIFGDILTWISGAELATDVTTLETGWGVTGSPCLMRRIFVVADATVRAALVAKYVSAPRNLVIDATHPLFFWKADEAAGAQLQYTVDGTTFATIGGGGGTTLFADPNADRLVFWDDSVGAFAALTPSTGLILTGTDLTVRDATDAQTGIVELATPAETITGADDTRATHPAGVKAAIEDAVPGAWTAYTPTVSGITLGNGVVTGQWVQIGKTVHVKVKMILGSTTAMSGLAQFSIPLAARAGTVPVPARAVLVDTGANYYGAYGHLTSILVVGVQGTNGVRASFSATSPFTWAASDEIHAAAAYESA